MATKGTKKAPAKAAPKAAAKPAAKTEGTTKSKSSTEEKTLGNLLSYYIYAALEDKRGEWNGDARYSVLMYENYPNLQTAGTDDHTDDLKSVFSLSTEIKQFVTILINRFSKEAGAADLKDGQTPEEMIAAMAAATDDSFAEEIFKVTSQSTSIIHANLADATDKQNYIYGLLSKIAPKLAGKNGIISPLEKIFTRFIKILAANMCNTFWYTNSSFNEGMMLAALVNFGFTQTSIDMLREDLREKPEPKPRAAKPVAPADAAPAAAPADAPADAAPADAPAETAPVADDDDLEE